MAFYTGTWTPSPSHVWDVATLEWIPAVAPAAGGGGAGTSDATAANQTTEITHLAAIRAEVEQPNGAWSYVAGVSGTEIIGATKRVIGISAIATAAGATLSINGGASVPIPTDTGISITPNGNLIAPTIVFTGTASYFVECVI